MTLEEILKDKGISRALIVDDCFDEIPLANDLADIDAQWANFHDDWDDDIEIAVGSVYEGNLDEPYELRSNDAYVEALWNLRKNIGAEAIFEDYEAAQRFDIEAVARLEAYLGELGLNCVRAGRAFADQPVETDLIVIDLFLGATQDPGAADLSKSGLSRVAKQYGPEMPPVILFSNSSRLAHKKEEYRDVVGLLESGFRILGKSELKTDGALKRQLERLVVNRNETKALAGFLDALEKGMAEASNRTLSLMRGMNLSDLSQVRQLLLEFEGKAMGAYLVDVFDRVLQYEIEGQEAIIAAADELSKLDELSPGPPYLAGEIKTQDLVARMISQAGARLPLGGSDAFPVVFGDVFIEINEQVDDNELHLQADQQLGVVDEAQEAVVVPQQDESSEVFLVVTPACDLVRGAAESVLLLKGRFRPITDQSWLYKGDRSPAVSIQGTLCRIDWDLQKYQTREFSNIKGAIDKGELVRVARLRQPHTLELQQKLLTSLGRVGLPAPMPASIKTTIDAYIYGADRKIKRVEVPELSVGSACFVGRDKDANRVVSLVLAEAACENVLKALDNLSEDDVHASGKAALKAMTSSTELIQRLEAGVQLKSPDEGASKEIKVETKGGQVTVLHLIWNGEQPPDEQPVKSKLLQGLVFHVRTHSEQLEQANMPTEQEA
ncbi:MAG: hypothetical protein COA78_00370 [Blastopirellula sp.]|nr:MAG: hypothetical protein COA78_00370 [Blastopirellula sp.]